MYAEDFEFDCRPSGIPCPNLMTVQVHLFIYLFILLFITIHAKNTKGKKIKNK